MPGLLFLAGLLIPGLGLFTGIILGGFIELLPLSIQYSVPDSPQTSFLIALLVLSIIFGAIGFIVGALFDVVLKRVNPNPKKVLIIVGSIAIVLVALVFLRTALE